MILVLVKAVVSMFAHQGEPTNGYVSRVGDQALYQIISESKTESYRSVEKNALL